MKQPFFLKTMSILFMICGVLNLAVGGFALYALLPWLNLSVPLVAFMLGIIALSLVCGIILILGGVKGLRAAKGILTLSAAKKWGLISLILCMISVAASVLLSWWITQNASGEAFSLSILELVTYALGVLFPILFLFSIKRATALQSSEESILLIVPEREEDSAAQPQENRIETHKNTEPLHELDLLDEADLLPKAQSVAEEPADKYEPFAALNAIDPFHTDDSASDSSAPEFEEPDVPPFIETQRTTGASQKSEHAKRRKRRNAKAQASNLPSSDHYEPQEPSVEESFTSARLEPELTDHMQQHFSEAETDFFAPQEPSVEESFTAAMFEPELTDHMQQHFSEAETDLFAPQEPSVEESFAAAMREPDLRDRSKRHSLSSDPAPAQQPPLERQSNTAAQESRDHSQQRKARTAASDAPQTRQPKREEPGHPSSRTKPQPSHTDRVPLIHADDVAPPDQTDLWLDQLDRQLEDGNLFDLSPDGVAPPTPLMPPTPPVQPSARQLEVEAFLSPEERPILRQRPAPQPTQPPRQRPASSPRRIMMEEPAPKRTRGPRQIFFED